MLQFNANVKPEFVNIPFFPYVYLYDVDKSLQKVSEEINKFIDLQFNATQNNPRLQDLFFHLYHI